MVVPNFTVDFKAMGTTVRAWLNVPNPDRAQVLQQVPAWVETYEATLSRFRPTSELSYLNAHAGHWVRVLPLLFRAVSVAVQAADMTGGLVNPLILPALEAAGYDHSFDPVSFRPGSRAAIADIPDWREIGLDSDESCIYLPPGSKIDLGGVAKGWIVQQVASRLNGAGPCLVDAGGDLVARGKPVESGLDGWLVTTPGSPNADTGSPRHILLRNAAVATSGVDYRRWSRNGQEFHHLIDPRTGLPARSDVLTATVVAPDAVQAEAWAKASLIGGALPDLPALFVYHNGSTSCNAHFEELWR
jgi:thiamine biosynthesis lipoprotein